MALVGHAGATHLFAGEGLDAAAVDDTFHAAQAVFNGASSRAYVDGSGIDGDGGTPNADTQISIGDFGASYDG